MKTAKYNFRRKENKEKAVYKLVIYLKANSGIKPSYTNNHGNKVSVYYGYYKKQDFGLQMLRSIAQANKDKISMAMIYAKPNQNPNHQDFSEVVEKY